MTQKEYWLDRVVRLKFDITTRGNKVYLKGTVAVVYQVWRGKLTLHEAKFVDGKWSEAKPGNVLVSHVAPCEVESIDADHPPSSQTRFAVAHFNLRLNRREAEELVLRLRTNNTCSVVADRLSRMLE